MHRIECTECGAEVVAIGWSVVEIIRKSCLFLSLRTYSELKFFRKNSSFFVTFSFIIVKTVFMKKMELIFGRRLWDECETQTLLFTSPALAVVHLAGRARVISVHHFFFFFSKESWWKEFRHVTRFKLLPFLWWPRWWDPTRPQLIPGLDKVWPKAFRGGAIKPS